MKRRAKELQQAKREAKRMGGGIGGVKYSGGFGSSAYGEEEGEDLLWPRLIPMSRLLNLHTHKPGMGM